MRNHTAAVQRWRSMTNGARLHALLALHRAKGALFDLFSDIDGDVPVLIALDEALDAGIKYIEGVKHEETD